MREFETPRMKQEAGLTGAAGTSGVWEPSRDIKRVTDQRMPCRRKMDPNLVRPARRQPGFHDGDLLATLERPDDRARGPAAG